MMHRTPERDNHRLTLDLSPEAYERLHALREKSGARSLKEVIDRSLRLYDWFLEETHDRGHDIALVKGDEVVKVLKIMF